MCLYDIGGIDWCWWATVCKISPSFCLNLRLWFHYMTVKCKQCLLWNKKYLKYLWKVWLTKRDFGSWKKQLKKSSNVVNKVWVPSYNNQILIADLLNHTWFNSHLLCTNFFWWKVVPYWNGNSRSWDIYISYCCCICHKIRCVCTLCIWNSS